MYDNISSSRDFSSSNSRLEDISIQKLKLKDINP